MKTNTKSSITLPADELQLVDDLRVRLKLKTKVEVVRRGLRLLEEMTDREALRRGYQSASRAVRETTRQELQELDHLAAENLD